MLRRVICLLSLVVVNLTVASATAQEPPGDEETEVRRYTVEMIIFSYAQGVSAGSEIFVADKPPIEDLLAEGAATEHHSLPSNIDESVEYPADHPVEEPRPYEVVMLDEADFSLDEVYEHLRRLDAYKPIAHFGWTQPTYPQDETEARPLSTFITPPNGLEGELSLYLSRYLHLAVNFRLQARSVDAAPATPVVRYRIEEDRIFRNGELRYFDHPKFGVLARISRVVDESVSLSVGGE